MPAKKKRKPFKFEKKVLNRPDWDIEDDWDQEDNDDEHWWDEEEPTRRRKCPPLRLDEPEPRWLVPGARSFATEPGSAYATIRPGQWERHYNCRYRVRVHRLARAVAKEIDQLSEKAPSLPWPVEKKPINCGPTASFSERWESQKRFFLRISLLR